MLGKILRIFNLARLDFLIPSVLFKISHIFFYQLGEATKDRFEGIMLSDAASDSNFIRSNGKYLAVSPNLLKIYTGDVENRFHGIARVAV